MRKIGSALLVCCFMIGCSIEKDFNIPRKITINGDVFVDEYGREVVLNGINVVNKNPEDNYLYQGGPEFYKMLKQQGFNSIRFIIIWDGVEPQPGVYDEAYLSEVDKRVEWAAANDLFVILDMHQDLYSVDYADGAPQWATITDGKAHTKGEIWSDSYMLSEAVQTAFDHFWNNTPAPDGIGIQDHYAKAWQYVAKRYANNPSVIGYDIMNEPFIGSAAQIAMPTMLQAYGELIYKIQGKILTEEELLMTWAVESNRTKALDLLSTEEYYSYVIDALFEVNAEFESIKLQAMYQKVANEIREVDNKSILFLEHSYFSNMGVRSSIERVKLKDGRPDPLVAYAPHGYDLVTDTKGAAAAESERVQFIYKRIKENGERLEMPIWLGEWGAYYNFGEEIVPVAQYAISLIEKCNFGHAYWSYDGGTENKGYFKNALLRPYPAYTNGELLAYSFNRKTNVFTFKWTENSDIQESTMIFVPDVKRVNMEDLPLGAIIKLIDNTEHGWVIVKPIGTNVERSIKLQLN